MKEFTRTGKSINDILDQVHEEYGVPYAEIDWELLEEAKKGFLGIGAKPCKLLIKLSEPEDNKKLEPKKERAPKKEFKKPVRENKPVKPAKPTAEPKVAAPKAEEPKVAEPKEEIKTEPKVAELKTETPAPVQEETVNTVEAEIQSERANLTDEDKAAIIKVAVDFIKEVLGAINMNIELDAQFVDNKQIIVEMKGEDMGTIIGKRGQTLDSLQYLTNLVVNRGEYPYMNVTLDTEGYRARRKETLERLAFNLAKKAKHNRRNVNLEPMNPYERRIIHATLQNDRYVTTHSEGVEPYRYVVITLKNNYSSRRNRY